MMLDTNESGNHGWTVVPRGSGFDPGGSVYAYVCPRCGHVDLFMNLPEDEQPE